MLAKAGRTARAKTGLVDHVCGDTGQRLRTDGGFAAPAFHVQPTGAGRSAVIGPAAKRAEGIGQGLQGCCCHWVVPDVRRYLCAANVLNTKATISAGSLPDCSSKHLAM